MAGFSTIVDILRFFITAFTVAMNMNRIMKTNKNTMDDILFILSIIFGIIVGIYFNEFIKMFKK